MPFLQRLAKFSLPFFQRLLRLAVLGTFFPKASLTLLALAFFPKAASCPNFVALSCETFLPFFQRLLAPLLQRLLGTFFSKGCCTWSFFQSLLQLAWASTNLALKARASGLVKPLASISFFIFAITVL